MNDWIRGTKSSGKIDQDKREKGIFTLGFQINV